MRILAFPARYATEINRTLDSMRRQIRADQMISGEDSPWPNGIIDKDDRDGTIYVCVAELPDDAEIPMVALINPEFPRKTA